MLTKRAKELLFPIDERMRVFGGDDRLYFKLLYSWYKYKLKHDVTIRHLERQTANYNDNKDLPILKQICNEEWRNIIPYKVKHNIPNKDIVFSFYN
jgi:hypothetical protein